MLRFATGVLAIAAVSIALARPAEAAPSPSFYSGASRLDDALRNALERQPEGLLKSLGASERVCGLGEGAEARGETEAAEADWSTLNQIVERLDEPGVQSVLRTLNGARSELSRFESSYLRAWHGQHPRVERLRSAAGQVRHGIGDVIASLAVLDTAFAAWKEHRCEAALAASATANQGASAAVARIADGMASLWLLGEPTVRAVGR